MVTRMLQYSHILSYTKRLFSQITAEARGDEWVATNMHSRASLWSSPINPSSTVVDRSEKRSTLHTDPRIFRTEDFTPQALVATLDWTVEPSTRAAQRRTKYRQKQLTQTPLQRQARAEPVRANEPIRLTLSRKY
jgi:hypothetical protein